MAGAGYDISLAASQASTQTLAQTAFTNIVFSGASLTGGSSTTEQRDLADATATNRSPGTTNALSSLEESGRSTQSGEPKTDNNKMLLIAGAVLVALLLLRK